VCRRRRAPLPAQGWGSHRAASALARWGDKDVDIIVLCDGEADIVEVLQDALEEPCLDFAFRV
jgi:hypothetical protein